MGLTIKNASLTNTSYSYTNTSQVGFWVEKKVLSTPYNLYNGNLVNAEIISVYDTKGIIKELSGKKIKLIFISGSISKDMLIIHNEDWAELRDYGLLIGETFISIKVDDVIKKNMHTSKEETTKIYPKRDVEING